MYRQSRQTRLYFCVLAILCLVVCSDFQNAAAQTRRPLNQLQIYQNQHRDRHQQFVASLEKLAQFCDDKGFREPAAAIRQRIVPVNDSSLQLATLPTQIQPKIPTAVSADERYWRTQLRHQSADYAKDLYLMSRRLLKAGYPSYAYKLLLEVAQNDPDHRTARRLLGYERLGEEWVTPFAAQMLRKRYQWHDKFGWLPSSSVERYARGERYYKGWMSAAKEAELRRDFANAWQIRTDHYLVKTNHSLERGVELAKALEDFYRFFRQTFAGFFNTPKQLQKLFEGPVTGSGRAMVAKPYLVHYYRTRDEYNRKLIAKIPQVAITNGLYLTDDRTAYFFHNPDPEADAEATLFHEATHQMLYEAEPFSRRIAGKRNFWIIEGIACYMESFKRDQGNSSLGDPNYIRFNAARHRYLVDRYYVPLNEFTRMGMVEFQTDPNISKNYSQASGLSHFFMHYDGGKYREALTQHLLQIYSANPRRRAAVQSLAELTDVSFKELDQQYGEFLTSLQKSLDAARRQSEYRIPNTESTIRSKRPVDVDVVVDDLEFGILQIRQRRNLVESDAGHR